MGDWDTEKIKDSKVVEAMKTIYAYMVKHRLEYKDAKKLLIYKSEDGKRLIMINYHEATG